MGALFIPRRWCSPAWGPTPYGTCHFPAASPVPRCCIPSCEADGDETPSRVHSRSPVRSSPGLWSPDGTGTLGRHTDASHPAVTRDARQGRRQALSTGLELHLRHRRTSIDAFTHNVRPRVAPAAPSRPGPIGRRWAQPNHPHWTCGSGRDRDGSRVHCDSLDEGGAQLYPCGIATATPQHVTVASRADIRTPAREFPAPSSNRNGCAPRPARIRQI